MIDSMSKVAIVRASGISLGSKGLVTNNGEGGLQNGRRWAREVLPLRKGGAEKVLAML